MILREIELSGFRNLHGQLIPFGARSNVIFGENAQGKTNLLEAIHCLCLTKSFRSTKDLAMINHESSNFLIKGNFEDINGQTHTVGLQYSGVEGKRLVVNHARVLQMSRHVGQFPVVVVSPQLEVITHGPPSERRKVVDILLSQVSREYLRDLQQYEKVLRQKNQLLSSSESPGHLQEEVPAWNHGLAEHGARIINARTQFVAEFEPIVTEIYSKVAGDEEPLGFRYRPSVASAGDTGATRESFAKRLVLSMTKEIHRGASLYGPQRDDFVFEVQGRDLRRFGSSGQHKSVLIVLKLAEYQYIRKLKTEYPILLCDDLDSYLDDLRVRRVSEILLDLGQTFITTTSQAVSGIVQDGISNPGEFARFRMSAGNVSVVA